MKKLLLSGVLLASFTLATTSCGENKDAKTEDTPTETATTNEGEKPAETPAVAASDAPKFSNEDVNKGLAEFKTLMGDYTKALADKDQAKLTELGQKYATWAQGAASWGSKLKPEEVQQYSDYMTKLSKEWTDAAMNAAK